MKVKELVQLLIELPKEADDVEIYIEYDGPDAHSERDIAGLMYGGESVTILGPNNDLKSIPSDIYRDREWKMSKDDAYASGWFKAKESHEGGVEITTHLSQGDSKFDEGWNAYIDSLWQREKK